MKKEIIQAIRGAFKEYVLVKGFMGLKATREMEKALWTDFMKSLEWRIDEVLKHDR